MFELKPWHRGDVDGVLLLSEDGVADVAILADDLAFRADVVAVVAAETGAGRKRNHCGRPMRLSRSM